MWTLQEKKLAARELLAIANQYEVKRRKHLKLSSIRFFTNGRAQYIGQAHDYSTWRHCQDHVTIIQH